jgi:cytochrome c551/c552
MKKSSLTLLIVGILILGLAACSGGSSGRSSGSGGGGADVAAGEKLFNEKLVGTQPGCVTCHSLEKDVKIVGPSLAGIGDRAGSTVDGQSAEVYLKESITKPDAHVVDGFEVGTMPAELASELSDQDVNNLIGFLMTQK